MAKKEIPWQGVFTVEKLTLTTSNADGEPVEQHKATLVCGHEHEKMVITITVATPTLLERILDKPGTPVAVGNKYTFGVLGRQSRLGEIPGGG